MLLGALLGLSVYLPLAAGQATGTQQQYGEQNREGQGIAPTGGCAGHQRFRQTHQQPTGDRAWHAAKAAEHQHRQALEAVANAEVGAR